MMKWINYICAALWMILAIGALSGSFEPSVFSYTIACVCAAGGMLVCGLNSEDGIW